MTAVRALLSALMSKGVLSRGWYAILTGLAMLYVAFVLGPAVPDDPAALYVGLALGVVGVCSLERGIRAEVRRRRAD